MSNFLLPRNCENGKNLTNPFYNCNSVDVTVIVIFSINDIKPIKNATCNITRLSIIIRKLTVRIRSS